MRRVPDGRPDSSRCSRARRRTRPCTRSPTAWSRRPTRSSPRTPRTSNVAATRASPKGLLDRLTLDERRIGAIAEAVRDIASLPDPVGEVVRGSTLANGLQIRQMRVPMGVVGMIYEARPNVTVDAATLGLKSGNAVILRGGSAAASSNRALVGVMRKALVSLGIDENAVCLLDGGGHDAARALMTARGLVDLRDPPRRRQPHPDRGDRVHGAGHRDGDRRQPRLRRRGCRPRRRRAHRRQRQGSAAQRLQRGGDPPRPRVGRRGVPAQGAGRPRRRRRRGARRPRAGRAGGGGRGGLHARLRGGLPAPSGTRST